MSKNDMVMVPREVLEQATCIDEFSRHEARKAIGGILAQPAQQHQGEPVAWQCSESGRILRINKAHGSYTIPLYTDADPAKAEQLRAVVDQQKSLIASLRAELVESYSIDASAEPSAPVEIDERAENSERYLWLKENVTGGSLGIPGGWIDDETEHWDRIIDTERKP